MYSSTRISENGALKISGQIDELAIVNIMNTRSQVFSLKLGW